MNIEKFTALLGSLHDAIAGEAYECYSPPPNVESIQADILQRVGQALDDLATLLPIGRMYLDALDDDPANEMLTLPEAIGVTAVREAVARGES